MYNHKDGFTRLVEKIGKLESIKLPIFVLVDELDRCRPTFSIQLLENIKHLFGVPGVYFVIATNIDQLSHSVGAVYGTGFNSEGYLKRFFDQEYILPEPDNESYAEFLFEKHSIKEDPRYLVLLNTDSYGSGNFNVKTFSIISSFFKLGLRDQEQVANSLSAILLVWPHKHIHLTYILILLMAKHRSMQAYKKLVDSSFLGHEFAAGAFTQLDVDRSVRIKRMEFDFNNTRQENQSFLIDIFWQYHSNAMIDMRDLRKQNHSRSGFPAGTIIEGILLEMPNSYMSSQEFPSSLKTYSSIVNQVGDLLV